MSDLFRPKIVEYRLAGKSRTPEGKRVTKDTPGAVRTERRSKKWYGRIAGQEKPVPLSESKETARRMLNKQRGDAEMANVGLVDPFAEQKVRPLAEHLEDFRRYLVAKGNTKGYCTKTVGHVRDILAGCGWERLADMQPSEVVEYLAEQRQPEQLPPLAKGKEWYTVREAADVLGICAEAMWVTVRKGPLPGPEPERLPGKPQRLHKDTIAEMLRRRTQGQGIRTSNDWLSSIKRFSKWLVKERRAAIDPLAHLSRLNAKTDVRHPRRALPGDDFGRFAEALDGARPFRKLTGADRLVLYTLSIYTGLRAGELASLTPGSFDLDAEPPTVTVEAAYSKHRREDIQPLRRDVAEMMRGYLAGRPRSEPVWPGTWAIAGAEMLRKDLARADIPYEDEDGQVLDFHGLRHTFLSALAASGVHPKVAQVLARHSSITLTMDYYTHLERVDVARGLDGLPQLPGSKPAAKPEAKKRRRA